jgi:hypothetical protein
MPVTILLCGSIDHAGYQIEQVRDATEFFDNRFFGRRSRGSANACLRRRLKPAARRMEPINRTRRNLIRRSDE